MEVLYLLLPLSVVLALVIALVLLLAVRSGQFDDLEGPAYRVLADDDNSSNSQASVVKPRDHSAET
ncbi:MAG: cbb3-type cytochrome oxidase assembly protein CcoS [Gammaproteobacteria bacterium]|nr:cbb3-type cytochrome oxidase assembly protein CcoS [Gammaproteobacteria bacterium]MDH3412606.1 cbb3-type cytochrome oxidase assembly protein CcoS [Gammaproteobacteria bacterium]